jgi:hypothetical protein
MFGLVVLTAGPAAANTHGTVAQYNLDTSGLSITSSSWDVTLPSVTCRAASHTIDFNLQGTVYGLNDYGYEVAFTADCINGVLSYGGELQLSNSAGFVGKYVYHAKPGDTIRTAFTVSSTGGSKIVVQDVTKGTSFVASLNMSGITLTSASWQLDPDVPIAAPFSPISWSGITVNGSGISGDGPMAYDAYNGAHLLVKTSALKDSGTAFTQTFVARS